MQSQERFPDNDRLARFLRESVDRFMERLDIRERTSDTHEDRVHYEEGVRFCLVTSLVPDVLAAACGVFDFDAEVINHRIPALLERALTPIPMDAAFISDAMARLPDHRRMRVVAENLRLGRGAWSLADEARDSFSAALYQTLDIEAPPIEGDWWLLPQLQPPGRERREWAARWVRMSVILSEEVPAMTTPSAPEMYCVKCRSRTESRDVQVVTMKNGRRATRSICVACGTQKFRIGIVG
jgi:hypothetical protein